MRKLLNQKKKKNFASILSDPQVITFYPPLPFTSIILAKSEDAPAPLNLLWSGVLHYFPRQLCSSKTKSRRFVSIYATTLSWFSYHTSRTILPQSPFPRFSVCPLNGGVLQRVYMALFSLQNTPRRDHLLSSNGMSSSKPTWNTELMHWILEGT